MPQCVTYVSGIICNLCVGLLIVKINSLIAPSPKDEVSIPKAEIEGRYCSAGAPAVTHGGLAGDVEAVQ